MTSVLFLSLLLGGDEIAVQRAVVLSVPETEGCTYAWHMNPPSQAIPGDGATTTVMMPSHPVSITCTKVHWASKQAKTYSVWLSPETPPPGPGPTPTPPEPGPGPDPSPEPSDLGEWGEWAAKSWLSLVDIDQVDAKKRLANEIAGCFDAHKILVTQDVDKAREQTTECINGKLDDDTGPAIQPWRLALAMKINEALAGGKTDLERKAIWSDIWTGVPRGLREAAK